jgi:uncharacterized protein
MKYLFIIAVVLVAVGLWRNKRRAELQDRSSQRPPSRPVAGADSQATEVVACAVCAVHLPRPEAVRGERGMYCSDAHRRQAEG